MSSRKPNPRKPGRYDGAAERADRLDQQASIEERRASRVARRDRAALIAQLRERLEPHLETTPARLRPLLERIVRRVAAGVQSAAPAPGSGDDDSSGLDARLQAFRESESSESRLLAQFFDGVGRVGFVYAAVEEIDNADYDKRPWAWVDRLAVALEGLSAPRREAAYVAILRAGLEHDKPRIHTWAAKALPDHVTDPARLAKILLPVLERDTGEPRWHAALTLARIVGPAEEVVDALAEAVGAHWLAHRREHWEHGVTGRAKAAVALAAMGPAAAAALPALRVALAFEDEDVAFGDARFAIADAIVRIGGREEAVSAATEALESLAMRRASIEHSVQVIGEVLEYIGRTP